MSATTAAAAAATNSHNQSHNLSHYLHNNKQEEIYQSRQRKHRSSQNHHRRRLNNLGIISADVQTDEARYNLATRIMSNGVEVIVAGDKTTLPGFGGHPNTHLRILTTTTDAFKIPLTLAPSTLKDQMLLMLPHSTANDPVKSSQVMSELQHSFYNHNQFVTKTCLTTYTYSTTYLVDGTTKIESREKVITNTATEERNAYNIRPTVTSGITLTQTPHLGTGVFKTTYTYLNTVLDGDQPVVITSQRTVTNTITAPEDYLSILQPSEPQTTLFETNTYYNTMVLTKTLTDNDVSKVISTTDIVKQVVITELLPSKSTSVMTSYIAIDAEGNESPADKADILKADILSSPLLSATDIVKTMYVTYTNIYTYLMENGSTIERTNISTTSAIATEKLFIFPTTKRMPSPQTTTRIAFPIRIAALENSIGGQDSDDDDADDADAASNDNDSNNLSGAIEPNPSDLINEELRQTVNLYATKTMATTFTFITTLLQNPHTDSGEGDGSTADYDGNDQISTVITSNTKIVENIVTESIPMNFLPSTAVHRLKLLFFGDEKNQPQMINENNKYTTMATLIGGQTIEITAVRDSIDPTTRVKDYESGSSSQVYTNLSGGSGGNDGSNDDKISDIDNTKNELENDQETAGSIDTESIDTHHPIQSIHHHNNNKYESNTFLRNTTKLRPPPAVSPVTNLIDSINNFNGLKVIRPMIEAVAGLIKPMISWNNDSLPSNTQNVMVQHHHHHTSPYPLYTPVRPLPENGTVNVGSLPPIPDYIENYAANHNNNNKNINNININQTIEPPIPQAPNNIEPAKGYARNPIYIPVNANKENGNYDFENLTPANFLPPDIIDHSESTNEIGQPNTSPKNKIIDGGIAISPGDVITANSDVIFGRPTGNRPRIPLNRDVPNQASKPVPNGNPLLESYGDSHSKPSIHTETYIGPPPPLPQKPPHLQHIMHQLHAPHQQLQQQPPQLQQQQPLPVPMPMPQSQHLAKATPQFSKIQIFRNKPFVANKPPHLMQGMPPHQHINRIRAHQNHLNKPSGGQVVRPNLIPLSHVLPTPNIVSVANGPAPQNIPTPNIPLPSTDDMHKYVLNVAGAGNDIIEIQRIPEVFSTDLPPVHIYHAPQEIVSFTAETIEPSQTGSLRPPQDIQTINQFPEVVESATGQPLFVNIQPSQIAKVVIPHGSSSALIFGGVQEMHKSGEYFDEPAVKDQVISIHSQPSIAVSKNVNAEVQDVNLGSVQVGTVPIISNQRVNVDSHVLSKDVDMHPPPIIFRNQIDTNDIPIASGTFSSAVGVDNQEIPHHQQEQLEQNHYNHALPSTGSLIRDNNRSPFVVDIQSINFGMSNEDSESSVSGEIGDESAAQLVHHHPHAPSIADHVAIDQHKDDDYENEQGEVIQESNAVPQLASSDQSLSENLNQIPNFAKPTTKPPHKDAKAPFTQTEANSLWDRYPSSTESYSVSFSTTERSSTQIPTTIDFSHGTSAANRHPFGVSNQVQIPSVAPSLINDMYAFTIAQNRSQTLKPLQPTRSPNFVTRNSSNKQTFYGPPHQPHQYHHAPQSIESRPPKFANIGTPHHHTLQNLPVPPHFVGHLFAADGANAPTSGHRSPHPHPHSRRPISINQKPFSRYPVYYNKPIPTNYSVQHVNIEPIKPNWHSSKPFDTHFGPNVPVQTSTTVSTMSPTTVTTRQPPSTQHDQSLQTSEIHHNSISTHHPFTYKVSSNKPDTEMAMITHYTDPSTNITQAAASSGHNATADLFDLTRGKPFVFHAPSNLNIGEETRPTNVNKTTDSKLNGDLLQADIFDYHEQNKNKVPSITEPSIAMETTDTGLPGITNAAFIPFGEKIKVTNPIMTSAIDYEMYPKTPATEMQPPPTHATKFKPYIQKHVPALSPAQSSSLPHHHENVLTEEVLGMQPPPPVPKLSVKQKIPSEIQGYGKVSMAHNLHPMHKPSGFYSITAPTHYPEPPPTFVTTHQQHHGNADSNSYSSDDSTELPNQNVIRVKVQPPRATSKATSRPTTTTNEPSSWKTTSKSKSTTTTTTTTTASIPTGTGISNFDDYVRYSIESMPDVITKKPFKYSTPRIPPSNGHMPQSPQFDENSLVQPSQYHVFSEIEDTMKFVQPTAALPAAETVKATRHTMHDAQVFTVTTTKTTVRSEGITSTILLTLTRTETSTIVDTITHTLVKPTRVTAEPTIKPTIFTAPVTMQKVSGTIVPNPSFSIYAIGSAHDESEHEHDRSNDSSEDQSFEFDNVHDMDHIISPTPKISEPAATKHAAIGGKSNATNDSIFVVMTDRKKLGTININADLLHTLTSSLQNNKTGGAAVINGHGNGEQYHNVASGSGTHKKSQAILPAIDDVSSEDEDDLFDLPKRDEDDQINDVSHVLIGGILIATPPKSEISKNTNGASVTGLKQHTKNTHHTTTTAYVDNNPADEIDEHIESQGAAIIEETRAVHEKSKIAPLQCQPECKAVNNEVCQITGDLARCVCRPSFARMFLDRPCKPTYTYTMRLAISQLQTQSLKYEDALRNPSSPKYAHLMQTVHDAIDRMVMQSELRDIYHGVHVASFNNITAAARSNGTQPNVSKASIAGPSPIISATLPPVKGIATEFHLQLSDNTKNEDQIMDVFKKYLQKNNFNLGGTNLYSSQTLLDYLRANDFDECVNIKYHDCSENAYCFNLRGTYTCSCREGFVDLSENPLYPGRVCSAEMMGCDRCNYHGACIEHIDEDNEVREVFCDCFQWYAGEKCQINLKVLLVGLIALGGILFALLLVCIILTCWKHNRPTGRRRTVVPGIDILPHKTLTVHSGSKTGTLQDRRAMIEDSSSETSEDSLQLPYVAKKQHQPHPQHPQHHAPSKNSKKVINKPTSLPPKGMAPAPPKNTSAAANAAAVHAAHAATAASQPAVMIPRAKYYSQQTALEPHSLPTHSHQHQHQHHSDRRGVQTGVATATQGQATMFTTTDSMGSSAAEAKLLSYLDASPSTSKNFVKKKMSGHNSKNHAHDDSLNHHYPYHSGETGALVSAGFEVSATVVHDSLTTVPNANGLDASSSASTNKKTTDHLVDWLTNVPEHELIISEARSYGETLVHPQTKTLVPSSQQYRSQNTSLYDKPLSTILMDEADTMAERDLGSTFLLPHTHLYKPGDRASDVSGFDSL